MNRVLVCDSLLKRNETEPFLKILIAGDEKWVTDDKNVRKRPRSKGEQAMSMVVLEGHYSLWAFTAEQNHQLGSLPPTANETKTRSQKKTAGIDH
ncbi:hypothetical protein EVAR_6578_1 [Eumeta japonica]|uniref:Histone-lysine N-methyltransferase SETMAR n=1 Tax=Eumeta variegata TaxID=151549 RepID=A0A4C1SR54_EUMVA|nr:hypothetical protein EVAR_6578_1 [Eumeta japonica]